MILTKYVVRYFQTSAVSWAAAGEKSLLASLRKKTGYTFANCKKALELHNNDVNKAEEWLKQQAQSLGWSKATKLEGRQTTQGLCGVAISESNGVLVEVNCETDFVARNKEFQKIVEETANTCLDFAKSQQNNSDSITKICLDSEQLKNLKCKDGKLLSDHVALLIGTVGENTSLKRALCLKVKDGIHLTGYAHPSGTSINNVLLGRLAGLVALKTADKNAFVEDVGKNLCQHIVGMNPSKIGSDSDAPAKNKDEETCLIHQEYLLDESLSVKDLLDEHKVEVVDRKSVV